MFSAATNFLSAYLISRFHDGVVEKDERRGRRQDRHDVGKNDLPLDVLELGQRRVDQQRDQQEADADDAAHSVDVPHALVERVLRYFLQFLYAHDLAESQPKLATSNSQKKLNKHISEIWGPVQRFGKVGILRFYQVK